MFLINKNLQKTSDEDLIILLSKGDTRAIEELYKRFSKKLLNYLLHMLKGNSSRAQDILQDVFLRVIEKAGLFRPQYKAGSWLFTIAGNLCRNEYRRLGRAANAAEEDYNRRSLEGFREERYTMESIDKENFTNALFRNLYKFNPENRSIFLLRFQEELSVKEIAEIMECPEGTVKSRLHYTVKKLAKSLKEFNPHNNVYTGI
jgi:RNA polymerase sigma-70 factor (ECF subfamily)